MKKIQTLAAAAFLPLAISACATQPDPYEVCSADWIEVRADKAIKEFRRDVSGPVRVFRNAADDLKDGGEIGPFTMLRVTNSLSTFVKKVENSRALEDLQLLGESCDDPDVMQVAVTNYLRREGAPDEIIDLLLAFDVFRELQDSRDEDSRQTGPQIGLP